MDFLTSLNRSLFVFCNTTIANPLFDATMPYFTDWHKFWIGRIIFGVCWILLLWKGGKKGRIIGMMMIPLVVITDQLASSVIKPLFAMPRPCHTVDGAQVMSPLRLLVDCGSGYSFPSSHATNNTAMAVLLSMHYRRWTPLWMS